MTMKIQVGELACAGHGRCEQINATLFPLDDDGFSALTVLGEVEVPAGLEDDARAAVAACPSQAIEITQES